MGERGRGQLLGEAFHWSDGLDGRGGESEGAVQEGATSVLIGGQSGPLGVER